MQVLKGIYFVKYLCVFNHYVTKITLQCRVGNLFKLY
ncbi:MAG: hypothetical protein JWO06_1180 [Bacteroidota bacterium]|nr:hypothetical protein [Bacteroidota bacterium]